MSGQTMMLSVETLKAFDEVVDCAKHSQRDLLCTHCGRRFDELDIDFVRDVGCCPYCYENVVAILIC